MHAPETIRSSHNPLIKRLRSLGLRKHREAERAFVVEGSRGIASAIEQGIIPQAVLLADDARAEMLDLARQSGAVWRVAERALFDSVMDTATPQGIAAVFDQPEWSFPEAPEPLLVLLDAVGDPGNLGTIVRTAAGAGCDAVVLGPGCADPWGAKAARASMGSIFSLPLLRASAAIEEAIRLRCPRRWLASGEGERDYGDPIWDGGVAVIIGSEGHGASAWGRNLATGGVRIPLAAGVESLNASVAAAVLIFEARRQRGETA
jgi:TrmH family RNA methyltransferase